jgi:hypothetical protein
MVKALALRHHHRGSGGVQGATPASGATRRPCPPGGRPAWPRPARCARPGAGRAARRRGDWGTPARSGLAPCSLHLSVGAIEALPVTSLPAPAIAAAPGSASNTRQVAGERNTTRVLPPLPELVTWPASSRGWTSRRRKAQVSLTRSPPGVRHIVCCWGRNRRRERGHRRGRPDYTSHHGVRFRA